CTALVTRKGVSRVGDAEATPAPADSSNAVATIIEMRIVSSCRFRSPDERARSGCRGTGVCHRTCVRALRSGEREHAGTAGFFALGRLTLPPLSEVSDPPTHDCAAKREHGSRGLPGQQGYCIGERPDTWSDATLQLCRRMGVRSFANEVPAVFCGTRVIRVHASTGGNRGSGTPRYPEKR